MISLCHSNIQTERRYLSVYHPYETVPSPQGLFNYQHRLRWDMFQEKSPICVPSPQGRIYDELFCLLISPLPSPQGHFYNIYLSRSLRRDSLKHLFIMQSPQGQFRHLFTMQSPQGQFTTFIYNPVSAGTTSLLICRNFIA